MRTQQLKRAGWITIAVLVAAGCASDRAILFSPEGPVIYNFALGPILGGFPSAELHDRVYDPGVTDDSAVRFDMQNLSGLSQGEYQVWLGTAAGTTSPAGRIVMFTSVDDGMGGLMPDSTELSASSNAFNPSTNAYDSIVVEVRQSALGANPQASETAFITIEATPASTPSAAAFLYHRASKPGGLFGPPFDFGTMGADLASDREYIIGGVSALGGVRGDEEISADVFEISRPPMGFFYDGWLLGDATTSPVRVDELRTSFPERQSLLNADENYGCAGSACEPNTNATQFFSANVRNFPSAMGLPATQSFCAHTEFRLVLQPKAAIEMGNSYVLTGDLPEARFLGC
jgi:hypothetical protein